MSENYKIVKKNNLTVKTNLSKTAVQLQTQKQEPINTVPVKDGKTVISNSTICFNRNFRDNSAFLRSKLGNLQQKPCPDKKTNGDFQKYKNYHYNGSFHKAFLHDSTTGTLTNNTEFLKMINSISNNDAKTLATVNLNPASEIKLVNPTASMSTVLAGIPQCNITTNIFAVPPTLSSHYSAAEMVEMYCHAIARDVPFIDYSTSPVITKVLGFMNATQVFKYLPDYANPGLINLKNLFKGISQVELVGPYISQLLLLNVPMGVSLLEQKYGCPPTKTFAIANGINVEWGRNNSEMIKIQNGTISTLPAATPANQFVKKYIFSGRCLAETVHVDPLYGNYFNAALMLSGLGAPINPTLPSYINQSWFATGAGGPNIQCMIAEAAGLALKHAWYWKWQVHNKLRPEVYSLWVDNIKNGRVANAGNYNISNVLLNNPVLADIKNENNLWGFPNSWTLPLCFREGSPVHPSYPSGHATVAGACITILKIFFNGETKWSDLPGAKLATINRNIIPTSVTAASGVGYAQANNDGSLLIDYTGSDKGNMTVNGEINKLGSNFAIGRNWSGVHYRTDAIQSMYLGEQVAIKLFEDKLSADIDNYSNGKPPAVTFRKLNGSITTLRPTVCNSCPSC